MEKNIYRAVFRRENLLQRAIFNFFLGLASYPRLALEVFVRRKFGRRYFTIASVVTVAAILLILPLGLYGGQRAAHYFRGGNSGFWSNYATWYIFTLLFIWFSYQRSKETFTNSNVYDYNYFSVSTGISNPFFYKLPIYRTPATPYSVEVFVEPGVFFLAGMLLAFLGQPLGMLLIICAVCYSMSYAASYKIMDDYFQDIIDKTILGEEIERSFIYGFDPDSTRGVRFKRRPSDEELRRKMASRFASEEDVEDAEYTVV